MNKKFQNMTDLAIMNTIVCTIAFAACRYLKLYNEYGSGLSIPKWYSDVRFFGILYLIISFVYGILFFCFRLYEKSKKYRLWLLKLFITIFILWAVGLLLQAINTFYWGYHFSVGYWWLNVLVKYLENCLGMKNK